MFFDQIFVFFLDRHLIVALKLTTRGNDKTKRDKTNNIMYRLTIMMGLVGRGRGARPHHGRGGGGRGRGSCALVVWWRGRRRRRRRGGGGRVRRHSDVLVAGRRTGSVRHRDVMHAVVVVVVRRWCRRILPLGRRDGARGRWWRRLRRRTAVLMVRESEHVWLGRRHVHYAVVMVMPVTVYCNRKNV